MRLFLMVEGATQRPPRFLLMLLPSGLSGPDVAGESLQQRLYRLVLMSSGYRVKPLSWPRLLSR